LAYFCHPQQLANWPGNGNSYDLRKANNKFFGWGGVKDKIEFRFFGAAAVRNLQIHAEFVLKL